MASGGAYLPGVTSGKPTGSGGKKPVSAPKNNKPKPAKPGNPYGQAKGALQSYYAPEYAAIQAAQNRANTGLAMLGANNGPGGGGGGYGGGGGMSARDASAQALFLAQPKIQSLGYDKTLLEQQRGFADQLLASQLAELKTQHEGERGNWIGDATARGAIGATGTGTKLEQMLALFNENSTQAKLSNQDKQAEITNRLAQIELERKQTLFNALFSGAGGGGGGGGGYGGSLLSDYKSQQKYFAAQDKAQLKKAQLDRKIAEQLAAMGLAPKKPKPKPSLKPGKAVKVGGRSFR